MLNKFKTMFHERNSVGPKETMYEIQLNFITCSVKCELIFLQAFMSDC